MDPELKLALKHLRGRRGAALGGSLAVAAALSVNGAVAGSLLDTIGADVSVAGVVAVAMTAAAAFRCLWHWRSPVLRPLGGTFAFVTVYELVVLVSYEPPSHAWGTFGVAIWPAIPLAYAAWGSAALAIAQRARGDSVGLASDWRRYGLNGAVFAKSWVPRPAHLWLWLTALVLSGLSLVPDLVYSGRTLPGVTWHGQPFQPHALYGVLSAWGVLTLFGSALLAEHGWRTRRPDLDERDRVLVRGAVIVSFVAASCASVLSVGAFFDGFWPEPVIDLLLAVFAIWYTIRLTASDDRPESTSAWPSRQYVLENAVVIALSTLLALTVADGPAMRGIEALLFTGLFTLFILSVRHVRDAAAEEHEIPSGLARFSAAEQAGLPELLVAVDGHTLRLWLTSLPLVGMRATGNQLEGEDREQVDAFAASLPRLLGRGATPRLLRLFHETGSVPPDQPSPRRPLDPTPLFVARVQTSRRAEVTTRNGELARIRRESLEYRLFIKSEPRKADGLPHYRHQGQISEMSDQEIIDALAVLKRRREGRPKRASVGLLEQGLTEIRARILDELVLTDPREYRSAPVSV